MKPWSSRAPETRPGNVAAKYSDNGAVVVAPGTLGRFVGTVLLEGIPTHEYATIQLIGTDLAPAFRDPGGAFGLVRLPSDSCEIRVSKPCYETVELPNRALPPGSTVDLGEIALPGPGLLPGLLTGLLAHGRLHAVLRKEGR